MRFEYVSGAVNLFPFDPIDVTVLNHGATKESVHIQIFGVTATGSQLLADSGLTEVPPNGIAGASLPVETAGNYWVQIHASSEFLIPSAKFTLKGVSPTTYLPRDFVAFESRRPRR